ncbi:hypothetical protein ONZ43_g68 [Nemania bipapillata]|uniref:Uncharacterized protein n=1 Tax=Nemania bipapillata TaxID=110536 RepID=A0ACC2J9T1_9PEZI|nr:hypothetical protein ONZ43_g68 [Nemania bipapillata]
MSSETTSAQPSRRRQTALAIVDAYNARNVEAIMSYRTKDCTQQLLPKSLDRPPMDNATYAVWVAPLLEQIRGFTITIHDVIEDAEANKVVMMGSSVGSSDVGPYSNEYALVLYMNEAGDKITKFFEFVDTNKTVAFFAKLRAYLEEKASAEGK